MDDDLSAAIGYDRRSGGRAVNGDSAMQRMAVWVAAAAAVALGGCATEVGPSRAELKAKWDAENVYPKTYRQDLLAFLRTYLNDPSHVRSAMVSQPQLKNAGPGDRYVACVRYNARNTDGKYQGSKDGAATYVAGQARPVFRCAEGRARALQGCGVCTIPGAEKRASTR